MLGFPLGYCVRFSVRLFLRPFLVFVFVFLNKTHISLDNANTCKSLSLSLSPCLSLCCQGCISKQIPRFLVAISETFQSLLSVALFPLSLSVSPLPIHPPPPHHTHHTLPSARWDVAGLQLFPSWLAMH